MPRVPLTATQHSDANLKARATASADPVDG